ncbi:MAG: ribosomal L7Ae/L30e/S12e/Gadd45 family protein [Acutalibacter sp.]
MKEKANEREASASKLAGLLGIARRAGKLITGFDAAAASAAAGKAALLLMAADLSEKTAKELRYAAREKKIPLARMPLNKEETGAACGFQKPVGVLATEDRGFATAMGRTA